MPGRPQLVYLSFLLLFFCLALFNKPKLSVYVEPVIVPITEPAVVDDRQIPDFESIMDVELKKQTFFNFLRPYIEAVNQRILVQRQQLLTLRDKVRSGRTLTRNEMNFLADLRNKYELENEMLNTSNLIARLLKRADIIPVSLALVQAANESAWGTSRFAQEGNNFFGQWCYTDGCGIVPNQRASGAYHEVKTFDSVQSSVEAYIMNLNTFPNYQRLRDLRQQLRDNNEPLDGYRLAEGLETYSQRGSAYVQELQSMMQSNNLTLLDHSEA